MKKIILLTLIFTVSLATSCKNYLDEEPKTGVSIDFLYSEPEGLKAATVALYNLNRDIYTFHPNENSATLYLHVLNDLVIARSGYISIIAQFDKDVVAPIGYGSSFLGIIWKHHYKVIDRANAIIKAGETIQGMDEDELNSVLAQARLFRAQSLFTLWRMFDKVYVATEPTTPENVFNRVEHESTKEEVFALLHEDFDFATANLPWVDSPGRMTKAVAHHLKAKAALWQEDWPMAAAHADSVINSGHYRLLDDVKDVFAGDRNSAEALWVLQFAEGQAGGGPRNFIPANFQTAYHRVEGAKYSKEQGGRGFAFFYPNDYLLELYDEEDARLNAYYRLKYYYNDAENLPAGVNLGDEIVIPKTGATKSLYYERIHPTCQKYYDENMEPSAAFSYNNILIYRLAETHLIAAEAYMKMAQGTMAFNRISPLQERAGVEPLFGLTELSLMKEHARELAFEGQRWFFLKRTEKLIFQVQHFSGDDDFQNDARGNIRDHMINFPIPQSELDLLGDEYPQNDGYN